MLVARWSTHRWGPHWGVHFPTLLGSAFVRGPGRDAMASEENRSGTTWLCVGTYTNGNPPSGGICLLELSLQSGHLTTRGAGPKPANPSFLGQNPWNLAIDPSGAYHLVANQNSDSLVGFAIDQQIGSLKQIGEPVSVPMLVCIQWYPAPTIASTVAQ